MVNSTPATTQHKNVIDMTYLYPGGTKIMNRRRILGELGFGTALAAPFIALILGACDEAGGPTPPTIDTIPSVSTSPTPSGPYYRDCEAARAATAIPLYRGQPGYRPGLDRDGDGIACNV
jgi:hypothetical protein